MATFGYHPENHEISRINTRPMMRALFDALGMGIRPLARALDTSNTAIAAALREDKNPPTLDTMSIYARRARRLGVHLTFRVNPGADVELTWSIHKDGPPSV